MGVGPGGGQEIWGGQDAHGGLKCGQVRGGYKDKGGIMVDPGAFKPSGEQRLTCPPRRVSPDRGCGWSVLAHPPQFFTPSPVSIFHSLNPKPSSPLGGGKDTPPPKSHLCPPWGPRDTPREGAQPPSFGEDQIWKHPPGRRISSPLTTVHPRLSKAGLPRRSEKI